MGEGCGNDAELMKFISSANIACGFHAGDRTTMTETVELAIAHNVAIGAHPGYRDLENFGRTAMSLPPKEVFAIVVKQIESLRQICEARGAVLHHVKPHGALYNQAARDRELAKAIAEAVQVRWTQYPTHVNLGQWYQPGAARKNVDGVVVAPASVFWNMSKTGK